MSAATLEPMSDYVLRQLGGPLVTTSVPLSELTLVLMLDCGLRQLAKMSVLTTGPTLDCVLHLLVTVLEMRSASR